MPFLNDVPQITIDTGPVLPDDPSGAKFVTGDTSLVWTDYQIDNRYENDRHLYMMGVTSPNGFSQGNSIRKAAVIQLSAPTLLWICDWTAARAKAMPQIPDPEVDDENWILLDDFYETHNVVLAGDGTSPIYRISGTYVYAHLNPPADPITAVTFPRPPWLESNFGEQSPDTGIFESGLTDK